MVGSVWIMPVFLVLIPMALIFLPAKANGDPFDLYGDAIGFDIYRNGEVIGEHVTTFSAEARTWLFNRERTWKSPFFYSCPSVSLSFRRSMAVSKTYRPRVSTDDDGSRYAIDADRRSGFLRVVHHNNQYQIWRSIFPTNHWNKHVTSETRVLNTITGNINGKRTRITPARREGVDTPRGKVMATRYDYDGDLTDTSAWYDDQGRWVKLRFKGRDGSTIEYRCRGCAEKGGVRTVWITGGGGGIGAALAKSHADDGQPLVYRAGCAEIAVSPISLGAIQPHVCDITDVEAVKDCVEVIGPIDQADL